MKRLDASAISTGVGFPLKSGSIDFLQDAHKETTAAVVTNLLGLTPETGQFYILYGLVNSGSGATYNVSAGAVFYNGEVYDVPSFSFTLSGSEEAWPQLVTTQYTTNADPVEFTDAVPRNVHNIRRMVVSASATGFGLQKFDLWVRGGAWIYGDTKDVVCDSTYLGIHFDGTGKGRKERKGWAIMNGNNGTPDVGGLVVVAYKPATYPLGATGGTPDSVVVSHKHKQSVSTTPGSVQGIVGDPTAGGSAMTYLETETVGESGVGKNMQPYIVLLKIMKIND